MLVSCRVPPTLLCLLLACCGAADAADPPSPSTSATAAPPRMFIDMSRIHSGRAPTATQRQQTAVALRLSGEVSNFDRDTALDGIAARLELVDAHNQPLPAGSGTIEFQLQYLRHQPLHTGLEIDPSLPPVRWTQRADDARGSQSGPLHLLPFRSTAAAQHSGWALLSAAIGVPGHGTFRAECWICIPAAMATPATP